jgi:putative ABC transport system ATP-binding protein
MKMGRGLMGDSEATPANDEKPEEKAAGGNAGKAPAEGKAGGDAVPAGPSADAPPVVGATPPAEGAKDAKGQRVIIRTVNLKKEYVKKSVVTQALRGVNAEIFAGEFISVMGPSGSGKSTFFNMVGGLDSPTSGRVFIDEVDVAQLTAVELAFLRCRKIGYIFQTYNLIQYMTALENVTAPMAFGGVNPDEGRSRGMSLLEIVGLRERWSHRPIEMSGGQQQRVAIARALANNPSVLLCDEPTANLDLHTGLEILEILRKLNTARGVTIICATHDHRMLDICDRLMWIRDGMIERIARRDEVHIEVGSIGGRGH